MIKTQLPLLRRRQRPSTEDERCNGSELGDRGQGRRPRGGYLHDVIGVGEHAADDGKEYDNDTDQTEEAGARQSGDVLVQAQRGDDEHGHDKNHPEADHRGGPPGRHYSNQHFAQRIAHDHVVGHHA